MNNANRRRYPRYETVVDVEIHTTDLKCKGIMRDISVSGIGVTSKKEIRPGTEVFITLKHKSQYIFKGTVMWSTHTYNEFENFYRMGIETNSIIYSDIQAIQFFEKSELVTEIISQIAKQDGGLLGIHTQ